MNQQPKALWPLISMEMTQIYSYFTLQAILVFYLTKQLSFTDANAYIFSAQFVALSFLMPVLGGWIADRFLGNKTAILLGGFLASIGYAFLTLQQTLFFGLSFIIIGSGLLRANISSFIGKFYDAHDARREAGFTLAYTGVNIGSLIAVASAGYIQKWLGFSACFAAASFALLLGLSIFRGGFSYFTDKGLPPVPLQKYSIAIFSAFCIVFSLIYFAIKTAVFGNYFVYIFGLLFCLYIAKISWHLDVIGRRHILALMILFAIAIFYKAMFFEIYLVINIFIDRLIDRTILGHEIPATTFLALGSIFAIILGPLFAYIWQSKKIKFSTPFYFACSIFVIGGCMQMLASWLNTSSTTLPAISIVLFRFFTTISELLILPFGLAVVTQYAPKNHIGVLIGGWYITAAFGGKLAGFLATMANVPKSDLYSPHIKMIYQSAFQHYAILSFILCVICLMLVPIINWLLRKEKPLYET